MVNLYATLIINKRRTFDQVPEKFKADVEAVELGGQTLPGPLFPAVSLAVGHVVLIKRR
ncbi:CD1375 family protein [Intestinimonas massiliensis]|uniref:CD1375 family protein n=1 Tax=Intestinimonas massiliensis (ex Afouda et al. 2020) TaxID=1673721 RepID=A0AAW5JRF6_9FIRM|nr:CD1375 family protein [Intestinimonas massiliensis (ex Afouda et al. 2020)]MCQ4771983.1 CD1375 family protein [Intestinimonas massiliensis (ex Afouda et al. 2020)]